MPLQAIHQKFERPDLADLAAATRRHRADHGCEAYVFSDGPALTRLAALHRPRRILELGTALGYTACCLAIGAASAAHVDTIEGDVLHARIATEQIAQRGLTHQVKVHHGSFDEVLPTLVAGYDMAFFDGYAPPPTVISRVRDLLREGGILVCSNLQLAHSADAKLLALDLRDSARWEACPAIESGRTLVLVKVGAI